MIYHVILCKCAKFGAFWGPLFLLHLQFSSIWYSYYIRQFRSFVAPLMISLVKFAKFVAPPCLSHLHFHFICYFRYICNFCWTISLIIFATFDQLKACGGPSLPFAFAFFLL